MNREAALLTASNERGARVFRPEICDMCRRQWKQKRERFIPVLTPQPDTRQQPGAADAAVQLLVYARFTLRI